MASTQQQLAQAYELIKQEQVDEALGILKPITVAEPDNVDAWWLLANAAGEPREARIALINVLKIDPNYSKASDAQELLDKLNDMYPPRDDELLMLSDLEYAEPDFPPSSGSLDPTGFEEEDLDIDNLFGDTGGGGDFESFGDDDPFALDEEDPFASDDPFGGSDDTFVLDDQPSAAKTSDDPFASDDDFDTLAEDDPFADLLADDSRERSGGGRRRILLVLAILLIPILAIAAFFGLSGGGDDNGNDDDDPGVTAQADPGALQAFDVAASDLATADQLEQVRQSTEQDAQRIEPAASALFVNGDSGLTLYVQVCAADVTQVARYAVDGIETAARRGGNTPAIREDLAQVGVTVQDCVNPEDTLFRATAPLEAAIAFSDSSPSDPEAALAAFRANWQVEN